MDKKIAVISGASRGIGKAVALDLSKQGYHVNLLARSAECLKTLEKEILEDGGEVTVFPVDVSQVVKVEDVIARIIEKQKKIDLLFNCAGILHAGTSDISSEHVAEMLSINLLGAIVLAKAVSVQMKKQKSGYIFNMSSMSGKRASPNIGVYTATKYGLVGYGESLFKELMPYGVKVTNLCPGPVDTDMVANFNLSRTLMINVNDIVNTVRYLLSLDDVSLVKEVLIYCRAHEMRSHLDGIKVENSEK